MIPDRRKFLLLGAGSAMAYAASTARAEAMLRSGFKAIVFDAFPILDPRPIATLAESFFIGKGTLLMDAWRARQFEYQWLRALAGRYVDFLHATEASLAFSAKQLRLEMSHAQGQLLLSLWSNLPVWPEVPDAIRSFRKAGFRLAVLSNMTAPMLQDGLRRAGLTGEFDEILSTDRIRSYKPDPRTYQMAIDRLRVRREEILFVPFAGWDVAGAKWFGYPTFWVNRLGAPSEELDVEADASGQDLNSLFRYVSGEG